MQVLNGEMLVHRVQHISRNVDVDFTKTLLLFLFNKTFLQAILRLRLPLVRHCCMLHAAEARSRSIADSRLSAAHDCCTRNFSGAPGRSWSVARKNSRTPGPRAVMSHKCPVHPSQLHFGDYPLPPSGQPSSCHRLAVSLPVTSTSPSISLFLSMIFCIVVNCCVDA